MQYFKMDDTALCSAVRSGDREAEETLVLRYGRLVRACARPYFLAGGNGEDLIQEGMIGLLKAIRDYDPRRSPSFKSFAELCIRSRLLSAIEMASRDKHIPLNNSIPFEHPLFSDHEPTLAAQSPLNDPESFIIGKEDLRELLRFLYARLSRYEAEVLDLYLNGFSYAEIAQRTGKQVKSVDNAVQRIRRKVVQQSDSGEFSRS